MRYISLCSGVEAASVAWHELGWTPVAFAEFEAFPSGVLAHRWPKVPNVGDITKVDWKSYRGKTDLIVGGPPCQAFSVAGLRNSLSDARGNLTLLYTRIIHEIEPKFFIYENVPGLLNTKDNAFGCLLAGLSGSDAPLRPSDFGGEGNKWTGAGVVAGKKYSLAWRTLDAQFFGVPQRRRRVFIVGYLGDWRVAAKILFELEGLPRNSAPSGEAGEGPAARSGQGAESGGGKARGKSHWDGRPTHPSLGQCAKSSGGIGASNQEVFAQGGGGLVPHPASFTPAAHGVYKEGVGSVRASGGDCGMGSENIIAFSSKDHGGDAGHVAPTLRAGGHVSSHANAGAPPAVVVPKVRTYSAPAIGFIKDDHLAGTLAKNNGSSGETQNAAFVLHESAAADIL